MNVLEVKELCIAYYGKDAVKDVSFTVPENKIVAIVGESGSGKSTVIKAIIKLLSSGGEFIGGNILFNGKDITRLPDEQMRKIRGEEIAMIFQDGGAYLNPRLKIGSQYLEMLLAHQAISKLKAKELATKMLAKLKLADPERIMKSYPFQLSGGMKQRVSIAMAMSMEPKLLLADEPTSALDVTVQAQVVQEMMTLRDELGTSVIIVTHNMGVASRMADYIAVMCEGELMEFGTRDQVIGAPKSDYTKTLLSVVPELKEVNLEEHITAYSRQN